MTEKNLAVVVEGVSIPSMIYMCSFEAILQFWQHVASPDLFFLSPWAGLPDCQHPFPKRILLRSELGYSQSIEGTPCFTEICLLFSKQRISRSGCKPFPVAFRK